MPRMLSQTILRSTPNPSLSENEFCEPNGCFAIAGPPSWILLGQRTVSEKRGGPPSDRLDDQEGHHPGPVEPRPPDATVGPPTRPHR
ncbi:MAG: hypothetical protein JWN52_1444 [Actinomycetia bacterium]|nr:hypothetical protein [Actinomycetes bacterium]